MLHDIRPDEPTHEALDLLYRLKALVPERADTDHGMSRPDTEVALAANA